MVNMEKETNKKGKNYVKLFLSLLLAATLFVSGVFGCSLFGSGGDSNNGGGSGGYTIAFKKSSLSIIVGDSVTFGTDDFTFTGTKPDSFSFGLESANASVLRVTGNEITALAEGKTTLTVKDKSDSKKTAACEVTVSKKPNTASFALATEKRSYTIGADKVETDVYAQLNGGKTDISGYSISWYVDGVKSAYKGDVYTFPVQTEPGSVTLKAAVTIGGKTYSDEMRLNWISESTTAMLTKTSGSITQESGDTSAVSYSLTTSGGNDVAPVIDWFVDGEIKASDSETFTFTPDHLGSNVVTATVNGVSADATDNVVTVSGTAAVPASLRVDYDTLYPSVLVTVNNGIDGERFEIKATNKSTNEVKTYNVVGSGECVINDIDLFSSDYGFKARSLGIDGVVEASDYCEEITQSKLTETEKTYLNKTWFGGNYYITSDEEFYEIYDNFMLFRSKPLLDEDEKAAKDSNYIDRDTEQYTDTHEIYMGYASAKSVSTLVSEAFERANYTGSYDMKSSVRGNVVTLKCTYATSSSPARTYKMSTVTQTALNANVPHVSKTGRVSGASLPVDAITATASVTTTDQLYRVLEMGYRPVFDDDTCRAKKYYDYARTLLTKIIDDDMTDVEKAHAIYDWIMWRVYYNNAVTSINKISKAVTYGAFYIEGVLTDENYLAVCDGMSKTYSLLCNMEGLPCRRIAGTAGTGGSKGGHAWNKVCVDGSWYIVDCTWGDTAATVDDKSQELATHAYFLKTDSELSSTHEESEYNDYPETSTLPYNYYAHVSVGEVNAYIVSDDDAEDYAEAIASLAEEELSDGKVEYTYTTTSTQSSYYMAEIKVADISSSLVTKLKGSTDQNPVVKALGTAYNVKMLTINDSIIYLISKAA